MTDIRHTQELSLLDRIGRLLHEMLDSIRREPIPERWTDLLNRLNAEEDVNSSHAPTHAYVGDEYEKADPADGRNKP